MCSKIKKVLVSLALASSLALAPMNVSAVNLTQSDSKGSTTVKYQNVESSRKVAEAKYTVEVPDSIAFTSETLEQDLIVKVKEAVDNKDIQVTPRFEANEGVTADIAFNEKSVTISGVTSATITASLDDANLSKDDYKDSTEIGQIKYGIDLIDRQPEQNEQ